MSERRDRTAEAGFLLAEMLTTLTISAFILAGLVGLGALLLRTADRGIARIDAVDDLGRTLASLDHLVRSAARARLDGTAAGLFLFNGDEHHLMLAHTSEQLGRAPVTEAVMLRSEPDGRLYRAEAALPPKLRSVSELHFGPSRLVYAGPARMRFTYAPQFAEGQPTGRTAALWTVGDRMPTAVLIEADDVADRRSLVTLRSPILADADAVCLDGTACGRGTPGDPAARQTAAGAPASAGP